MKADEEVVVSVEEVEEEEEEEEISIIDSFLVGVVTVKLIACDMRLFVVVGLPG